MSHFYGGIEGSRGPATRQGSKTSGLRVYAQSHKFRVTTYLEHDRDHDEATIVLSGGHSTYYGNRNLHIGQPAALAEALEFDLGTQQIFGTVQQLLEDLDGLALEAIQKKRQNASQKASVGTQR